MPQQKVTKASETPDWGRIGRFPYLYETGGWEFVPDLTPHKGGLMFAARRAGTLGNANPADFYPAVIRCTWSRRYGFRCRLTDRGWLWLAGNPHITRAALLEAIARFCRFAI